LSHVPASGGGRRTARFARPGWLQVRYYSEADFDLATEVCCVMLALERGSHVCLTVSQNMMAGTSPATTSTATILSDSTRAFRKPARDRTSTGTWSRCARRVPQPGVAGTGADARR